MIGFGPSIKNVLMKKSPVGNNLQLVMTKNESRSPHPRAFLECENTFFVKMNASQQVYSCQYKTALKGAEF
jgi:hypothetical protein